jgi:quinoprotein glucose dehydrogenase
MNWGNRTGAAVLIGLSALGFVQAAQCQDVEEAGKNWPMIGGTPGNSHYSTLKQINRSNVQLLEKAWEFDTGQPGGLETTPIVVDGILYAFTPSQQEIALDGATGKVLWKFDSGNKGTQPDRGITY